MGCGASAARLSANCPKIREIKITEVKIPEFDEVFADCKKPLNTIVRLNNDLYAYLDGVKIRAFCLVGHSKITLTKEENNVTCDLQKLKDDDYVTCLADELAKPITGLKLKAAWDKLTAAAAPLAAAAEAAAQTFEIAADDTIHFDNPEEEPTEQEAQDKLAAFHEAADKFNLQVYNVRAVLASINGPVSLSGAVCELKKHLMAKGHGFDFDFSNFSVKMPSVDELPKPLAMIVEVVEKLIDKLKHVGDIGETIKEEIEALVKRAEEFPMKAKDALSNSEMNPFEIIKAGHAIAMNVKNIGSAPFILTAVLSTCKSIPTEILSGIKDAVAGKPSVATPASPKSPAATAA